MKKLTDADAKSLKPVAGRRVELRDAEARGLALRVSESGTKTWVLWYWHAESKRKRRLTLGEYPDISLAAARRRVHALKIKIADGSDPAAEKQAIKREERVPKSLADAMDLFIERKRLMGRKAWKDDLWNYGKHIRPVWGTRPLKDIKHSNVVELLNDIAGKKHRDKTTKGIAANRVYSLLSGLFRFAVRQAWINYNPIADAEPPIDERAREFTLPSDQVRRIWQAVNTIEDRRIRDFDAAPSEALALRAAAGGATSLIPGK